MKTLFSICALAGALMVADAATERMAGSNLVLAQSSSSACFQNCANVRRWPAAQCAQYCRGKPKRK
jgi:hypothetical protein